VTEGNTRPERSRHAHHLHQTRMPPLPTDHQNRQQTRPQLPRKPAKEHTGYLATLGHASAPVIVDEAGNSFSGFRPDKLRQAA
ncbi:hypothetical protein ACL1CA_14700, partial [Corynebacterium striatum]